VIQIDISNDYNGSLSYDKQIIINLLTNTLKSENFNFAKISIILSNKEYIRKLKKEYFNVDVYTDVIAFNLEDDDENLDGELYISIDNVLENSKIYNVSLDDEFKRVLIHGVLHLVGYNDSNDKEKKNMTMLENKYIKLIDKSIISIS
tara:strand:- start:151 stop:594 length:444 start_codon:yes stop_codon:yes gene_type:complete